MEDTMFPLVSRFADLSSATTNWLAVGQNITCRVVGAQSVLLTTLTTGDDTITLSDGTTTIGTITITQSGCAVGDVDGLDYDSTSIGKVELNETTPLKLVSSGAPGQGAADVTVQFSEFMGAHG
jgi:hypothetical protein